MFSKETAHNSAACRLALQRRSTYTAKLTSSGTFHNVTRPPALMRTDLTCSNRSLGT